MARAKVSCGDWPRPHLEAQLPSHNDSPGPSLVASSEVKSSITNNKPHAKLPSNTFSRGCTNRDPIWPHISQNHWPQGNMLRITSDVLRLLSTLTRPRRMFARSSWPSSRARSSAVLPWRLCSTEDQKGDKEVTGRVWADLGPRALKLPSSPLSSSRKLAVRPVCHPWGCEAKCSPLLRLD